MADIKGNKVKVLSGAPRLRSNMSHLELDFRSGKGPASQTARFGCGLVGLQLMIV